MFVHGEILTITNDDKVGYLDDFKIIKPGSILKVENKKYKVLGLKNIELAFTGIRIHLNVKELS